MRHFADLMLSSSSCDYINATPAVRIHIGEESDVTRDDPHGKLEFHPPSFQLQL